MDILRGLKLPPRNAASEELYDYLFKLDEALRVGLSNLGEDNLSEDLKTKITGGTQ